MINVARIDQLLHELREGLSPDERLMLGGNLLYDATAEAGHDVADVHVGDHGYIVVAAGREARHLRHAVRDMNEELLRLYGSVRETGVVITEGGSTEPLSPDTHTGGLHE